MSAYTHYFTFGQAHVHPETFEPMKDYWIEIMASSRNEAREKMVEIFGLKWGLQYCERYFMKIYRMFPRGCYAKYEID